ncbi:MAG: hypothetical protein H6673_10900 [Anaerolineales bacterium]|nr:hypothetical protein [Anaerolineales bacterium]
MVRAKRLIQGIIAIPLIIFVGLFVAAGLTNGWDKALGTMWDASRELFCSATGLCDTDEEVRVLGSEELWTRIHNRFVLDTGKYETRQNWSAEYRSLGVTHTGEMNATVNITIGVNMAGFTAEDIVVDNDAESITVTVPPAQPVECFLADIQYHNESCWGTCDEIHRKLQDTAIPDVLDSEEFRSELLNKQREAGTAIATIIDPLAEGYTINFVWSTETPIPIEGASCQQ